jgi:type I site-specific restriction-modification system R (restriction) subunit
MLTTDTSEKELESIIVHSLVKNAGYRQGDSKSRLNRAHPQKYDTVILDFCNDTDTIKKTFLWFKDRIKTRYGTAEDSGKRLAEFLDSLIDKLLFTVITVTDELNAFKVFETLNARESGCPRPAS